jgi:hypothetical protein
MTLLYNVIYSRLKRQPDSRRNGSFLQLRPLGRSDGRLISSFVSHLTPDSTFKRFLSQSGRARHEWVANLINADQREFLVYGAIAINQFGSSLVAMAESIRDPGDRQCAEFRPSRGIPMAEHGDRHPPHTPRRPDRSIKRCQVLEHLSAGREHSDEQGDGPCRRPLSKDSGPVFSVYELA